MNHLTTFLNYLEYEKRYSQLTAQAYKKDLEQFFAYIDENYKLAEINVSHIHIRSWLAHLSENGVAVVSIKRKISSLKSFYKFLLKNNIITSLPTSKIITPKAPKRLAEFVQEDKLSPIMQAEHLGNTLKEATDKLILKLLYTTGVRRAELLNLKNGSIDKYLLQIKVLGKGNKERIIPIGKDILTEIENYIQLKKENDITHERFFTLPNNKPIYEKYIYLIVKKHLSIVSTLKKNSPHTLRHSFATHLLNNGAQINAVKDLLGHTSLQATQVYTHNSLEKLKNVFNKAHPKAKKS